jgi:hypothetical protein
MFENLENENSQMAWQHTAVIPAPQRLRQEAREFEASLGCIVRSCLKKVKNNNE